MLTEQKVLEMLIESGAVLDGHFVLSSGRHAGRYIQCAKVLEEPRRAEQLGRALAAQIEVEVDRVISPPLGGILIGHEVARALDRPFLFPERGSSGELCLRRGFTLEPGEHVLIVEDVVTTGKTTEEIITLLEDFATPPAGIAAIVDRSSEHAISGMPVQALIRLSLPNYAPEDCPMCAEGLPARKPGSRSAATQMSHV